MMIDPLIQHMKLTIPILADRIAGGVSFKKYLEDEPRLLLPAVYVEYKGLEGENVFPEMQMYEQLATENFNCYLVLDNTSDPRGQAAQNRVDQFRIALFASILNYQYLEQQHPIEFVRSAPYYMDHARYMHIFEFKLVRRFTTDDGWNPEYPDLTKILADWDLTNATEETYPNAQTENDF